MTGGVSVPDTNAPLPALQQRILDAALTLFTEQGFAATATRDIARLAGVSEGSIFRYYPTKKALLVGTVGPFLERTISPAARDRLGALLAAEYDSLEEFARTVATDRLAFARENPMLVRLVLQEIPFHPELRELFRATVMPAFLPPLLAALTRFQARGQMADMPVTSAARMLLSLVAGYAIPRLVTGDATAADDDAELGLLARVFAQGVAPAPWTEPT